MEFVRQALLPVLMSCAASSGNVKTLEELVNQVEFFYKDYAAALKFSSFRAWPLACFAYHFTNLKKRK